MAASAFLLLQLALQWLLYAREEGGSVHFLGGLFSALAVGALIYGLLAGMRARRITHKKRFETIAEANHHIRNALEAMQLRFHPVEISPATSPSTVTRARRTRWTTARMRMGNL
ncbi:MAG: hypothetical protein ACE14M_10545 [Terriglobales bacterium]